MPRYHLKADGNPAVCTAALGACPKGGDHFATEVEARQGFEASMAFDAWGPTVYSSLANPELFSGLASGLAQVQELEAARERALANARAGLDRPAVIKGFKDSLVVTTASLRSENARLKDETASLENHRIQQEEKLATWDLEQDEIREQEQVVKDLVKEIAALARERTEINRAMLSIERVMYLQDGAVPPGMHQCPACGVIIPQEETTCGSDNCQNDMQHMMNLEHEQWLHDNASWYKD